MKAKTSLFREVVGTSPTSKVLEYLLAWEGMDLTITDIVRGSEIGRAQAYYVIDNLKSKGIIKKSRKVGASNFYILDKKNAMVKALKRIFKVIIKESL
jgi:hypothetical protein